MAWPRYIAMYDESRCTVYQELFMGGASIPLHIAPRGQVYLNDSCSTLVNFMQTVANGGMRDFDPSDYPNDENKYYVMRDRFNDLILDVADIQTRIVNCELPNNIDIYNQLLLEFDVKNTELAHMFFVLNRLGFRGLCRFNKSGGFNVPYGFYKNPLLDMKWRDYETVMRDWKFTCLDFYAVPIISGAFLYVDPPYDSDEDGFTCYDGVKFDWVCQEMVAEKIAGHNGPIVVSNHATKRIIELYIAWGFDIVITNAPRRIAVNGNREPAMEIIACKNIDFPGR